VKGARGIATMRRLAGGGFAPAWSVMPVAVPGRRWQGRQPVVILNKGSGAGLVPGLSVLRVCRGPGMNVDEDAVRQLAQLIWETEGQPQGQEARHWEMATKLAESAAMAPVRAHKGHKLDTLFPSPKDKPGSN